MISSKIIVTLKGNPELDKQTTFATASALTMVAKEAQVGVRKALNKAEGGAFTIRNNWLNQSSPLGIRVRPATKQDLSAWVGTAADFLEKFLQNQTGVVVNLPHGKFLAVPTSNVRRTKREIIRAAERPRALRGKHDIVLPMKKGGGFVLFQQVGKRARLSARSDRYPNSRLVALYILVPVAKIKQEDVLFGPTLKVFEKRFAPILEQQLRKAFATAR